MKVVLKTVQKYSNLTQVFDVLTAQEKLKSCLAAYAVKSSCVVEEPDLVISIFDCGSQNDRSLPDGYDYVYLTDAAFERLTN